MSDEQLWQLASEDPTAFVEIFDRHVRAVHTFCARRTADLSLADDLTSIVFLEAWRRRRRAVKFSGHSARPWLLGVANNVIRNSSRAIHRYQDAVARIPAPSPTLSPEESVVDRIATEGLLADALRALTVLSRGERDAVVLVFWSQLTYEEAAVALGIPVGTVRSRLSRARRKLHTSLGPSSFELLEALN